jgi:peptide/nickel transport system permease protein
MSGGTVAPTPGTAPVPVPATAAPSEEGVRQLLFGTWRGRFGIGVLGFFVFIAIFGSVLAPDDPNASSTDVFASPSWAHPLGTTESGADVLSQLLVGARVSIVVGFAAAAISALLGSVVGLVGGYYGGWTDKILDALENWFLVIPTLPLMIVLARLLDPSLTVLIVVIGLTSWAGTGRIVRAQVLTLRERAFVERARALGAGNPYIIRTHILPNTLPLIFANTVLIVAVAILSEAALSFLGLGDPTRISWGTMLENAFESGAPSREAWWYVIPPGLCITMLVLAVSVLGYLFEEYINPRLREQRES